MLHDDFEGALTAAELVVLCGGVLVVIAFVTEHDDIWGLGTEHNAGTGSGVDTSGNVGAIHVLADPEMGRKWRDFVS